MNKPQSYFLRIKELERRNAKLLKALKDWRDMFEWGDFTIDFSNGVTYQGIDEGQVKGQAMLKDIISDTIQAITETEDTC